jgi:short-subunit dehydrogenase
MARKKPTNPVALITGASSGMGKAFAEQLAAQGYDLIMIARNQNKLNELSEYLSNKHSLHAIPYVADLSLEHDIDQVCTLIRETPRLEILINNAGYGTGGSFADNPLSKSLDMINLHVIAPTKLCHEAIPIILKNDNGRVINVSSIAAFFGSAGNVSYCATKAYLNLFTQALWLELRDKNIRIQSLCPGYTITNFHNSNEFNCSEYKNRSPLLWMKATKVVAKSLRFRSSFSPVLIPGVVNKLLVFFMSNRFISNVIRMIKKQK